VDTGIVVGHPEFQRKCLAGYDTVDLGMGKLASGMRLVGDSRGHDYNPYDDVGHGCLVAGVIGAQGWKIPRGAGGRTLILAVRVLAAAMGETPKRVGVGALADIDCGIKIAVDLGASVINMSFGTPASSLDGAGETPHKRVIRYASDRGCVLIAAAGNSGVREQYYPAALPEVIAVASVDRSGERSRFSTWGDHICISAPGERIISAGRRGYASNSGTSFASPFVSGVASLLVSRARRRGKHIPAAVLRSVLVDSASPLGGGGFHPETGQGLLNAAAAIRLLDRRLG
jgi:subtilisin family serine protease